MFTMGAGYVDLTRLEEAGVPALGPTDWWVDPRHLPAADDLAPPSSSA
jgi:hypothetical protein